MVLNDGDTFIDEVVSPVLQLKITPPVAVSIVLFPRHILFIPSIFTSGKLFTLVILLAEDVQPLMSVTVTVKVVFIPGFTIIEDVVAPVFQTYETPPDAVSKEDAPVQNVVLPLITATGKGFTTTSIPVEAEQPLLSVTDT